MEKPIRLFEFIISLLVLLGIIITAWVNINREQSDHEARLRNIEVQYNKLDGKVDKILDKIETLTIVLSNKQDRKN